MRCESVRTPWGPLCVDLVLPGTLKTGPLAADSLTPAELASTTARERGTASITKWQNTTAM